MKSSEVKNVDSLLPFGEITFYVYGISFEKVKASSSKCKKMIKQMRNIISFMKLKTSQEEFEDYFKIFLCDWEARYQKFIPRLTEEELKEIVDSTPIATKKQIERRYKNNPQQLKIALSYFE